MKNTNEKRRRENQSIDLSLKGILKQTREKEIEYARMIVGWLKL